MVMVFSALAPCIAGAGTIPEDAASASILAYYRIGEDAYPESNLRTDQFEEHFAALTSGDYTVLPLTDIIEAIKTGGSLPDNTIAITFEGAYHSILGPVQRLSNADIPVTIFYASAHADSASPQYLGWPELKKLTADKNITLGILPTGYIRLSGLPENEIRGHINKARQKHREMFGEEAKFFSYPYGEYSKLYKDIIAQSGFDAAFGLHSGTMHSVSNSFDAPRFTMTERYGDLERFEMVSHALPLPVSDVQPEDPYITDNYFTIGFTVTPALENQLDNLNCFISGQAEIGVNTLGTRIEIRPDPSIREDRIRINCTMPATVENAEEQQRWRWLGMLLIDEEFDSSQGDDEEDQERSEINTESPPQDEPL